MENLTVEEIENKIVSKLSSSAWAYFYFAAKPKKRGEYIEEMAIYSLLLQDIFKYTKEQISDIVNKEKEDVNSLQPYIKNNK